MCDTARTGTNEVEQGSPMGGGDSPAHLIEPQVELDEEFEPTTMEPSVELNVGAAHYGYGVEYYGGEDGAATSSNYVEDASDLAMDTSNSEAYDSSYREDETNYNEMQRTYLTDFFSSSGYQKNSDAVDETATDPNIERIPLCRFPSIVKVVERAEYETIQILYQLLYQRSAWDTQEILSKRILEFSGFKFGKNSEEYYNREMLLQTLPNSTLVKIGAILCLDHVKNVLSNVGLGRHDLINAIMEFLALPKKKTRAPRHSNNKPVATDSNVKPCGCRNNCLSKFKEEERDHLKNFYGSLRQKRKQDAYLFNLIKCNKSATGGRKPAKSVDDDDSSSFSGPKRRDYKYFYKVRLGTREIDVCKGGFMMVHDVKMAKLNHFQARLKKGCYLSKAEIAATVCPPLEGEEEPPKEATPKPEPSSTEPQKVEPSKQEKEPPKENISNSTERTGEESKDCSVENSVSNSADVSVSNSAEESLESMSSKAEDASVNSEDNCKIEDEVKKSLNKKVPAVMVEKIDPLKMNRQKGGDNSNKIEIKKEAKDEKDVKHKLKDFSLVVKGMDEASEELLIDLHFLLFLSGADSSKLKEEILEFDGFTFSPDSEEFDERNEFLQRMSGKLLTEIARSFSLGVKSKREETIENIIAFLMKPTESFLRTAPSVPVILSDVEIDDIEGMSDSDESITCEVVEKKVECIDLLAEDDDMSSGGEDSDGEGKKKKKIAQPPKPAPVVPPVAPAPVQATSSFSVESETPSSSSSNNRTLRDFETIRKIVNTHPPEYLVDIYELLFLKKHEPSTLRQEILDFNGFNFDKSTQDYVKRKQVLDRMLYNNVRRVYNTLIHNSTEVKVFSKPTMINEIFQFLFKLPDHDTSVRPLPPGAKTLMPKQNTTPVVKNKPTPVASAPNLNAPITTSILSSSNSGKLSDLKRVFQRVACFPCEYLVDVHKLLFMTDCDAKVIRQNIFGFKGFTFGRESPEFQQRKMYLEYLTFHSLRKISSVLTTRSVDLRNSTKHELASHLTDVLAEYCNTQVETSSIVPTLSSPTTTPTATPTTTNSSVENIVVVPSIEGLQSATPTPTTVSTPTTTTSTSANTPAKKVSTPSSSPMKISIVDTRSIVSPAVTTPSPSRRGRKRKSQTVKQMLKPDNKKNAPAPQAEFADIHLPEIEQYRQIYGANLNVYPSVPTITGIASFGTAVPQTFPQIVPQTMTFPIVSPYIQQSTQVLGLQSTAITMPTSIITQVSSNPSEMIVPADIEKPSEEPPKAADKTDISKFGDVDDEEDGDTPLASLIGHPTDSALENNISDIVKKTNLQDITMNKVIQKIYDLYPKFDLVYRKDFIKSTLRTILYKLGNENQNANKKEMVRDSSSPDCSVTTTDRDNSLPESPE